LLNMCTNELVPCSNGFSNSKYQEQEGLQKETHVNAC
jgi:hypothetical protein